MIGTPTATGVYVYGVVRSGSPLPPGTGDVTLVDSGPLAALTRAVSLDEFGEDALKDNLNDRHWLEENALAHEDTLLAACTVTAVVPFRFGTICYDDDHVRALLDEHRDVFSSNLDVLTGRIELGVKLWVDRAVLGEALVPGPATQPGSSGRGYLEARRAEQQRSTSVDARALDLSHDAYERLARLAVAAVVNRPQPRELTGRQEDMRLNAAFLVEDGDYAIADEVDRLNSAHGGLGVTFELTGPWPAHNFVRLPTEDA